MTILRIDQFSLQVLTPNAAASLVSSGCDCGDGTPETAESYKMANPDAPTSASMWSGVICKEGELTGDGRFIEMNALRWENLPIPIRYAPIDTGAHDGAQVVGRILTIERQTNGDIFATGDFDTASPVGLEAARHVGDGITTGVSVDLDSVSFEIRVAQEVLSSMDAPVELDPSGVSDENGRVTVIKMSADDEVMVTTDARVRAATIVAIPAFAGANIAMADGLTIAVEDDTSEKGKTPDGEPCSCDEDDPDYSPDCQCEDAEDTAPVTDEGDAQQEMREFPADERKKEADKGNALPDGSFPIETVEDLKNAIASIGRAKDPEAAKAHIKKRAKDLDAEDLIPEDWSGLTLVASSAPSEPPKVWFENPDFAGPTPLTVTEDGRVYGHLAVWGTCHTAYSGQCVEPPHSPSGYAYFRTGAVLTSDGTEVAVGSITLDTLHAGRTLNAVDTLSHYEHTGKAVADVAVGEDAYGIWIAGALRSGLKDERVRSLRASSLSGDWRRIGGQLELVAALGVNSPGFPVPRPQGLVASGGVMVSLVASGVLDPAKTGVVEDLIGLSLDDVKALQRLAARERKTTADEMAARIRTNRAAALARRVGVTK